MLLLLIRIACLCGNSGYSLPDNSVVQFSHVCTPAEVLFSELHNLTTAL